MSIASEIERLQNAKASIKTALQNQGQTISDSATLDTYATKVSKIPSIGNRNVEGISVFHTYFVPLSAYQFANCAYLSEATLRISVDDNISGNFFVPMGLFEDCSGLRTFNYWIPYYGGSAVPGFDRNCFKNTGITRVNFTGDLFDYYKVAFSNREANPLHNGATLYCDNTLVSTLSGTLNAAIKDYAFTGCTSLTSITADRLIAGKESFKNCTELTSITTNSGGLSSSITLVGEEGFAGCTKLQTVTYTNYNSHLFYKNSFKDCISLTTFTCPSLNAVASGMFSGCTALTTLDISNPIESSGNLQIMKDSFNGCSSLTTITGYSSSTNIGSVGENGFKDCSSLTAIPFETTINTVYSSAFEGCTSLTAINLSNATEMGQRIFKNCTSLVTANLSSLTHADGSIFEGCTALTSANLGNITWLNANSFKGCTSLSDITLAANSVCTLSWNQSSDFPASDTQHITIHVPSDLVSSYQTANNWRTLYNNGYIDFVAIAE